MERSKKLPCAIAVVGKKNSGRTTVTNLIQTEMNRLFFRCKILQFDEPLYEIAANMTGVPVKDFIKSSSCHTYLPSQFQSQVYRVFSDKNNTQNPVRLYQQSMGRGNTLASRNIKYTPSQLGPDFVRITTEEEIEAFHNFVSYLPIDDKPLEGHSYTTCTEILQEISLNLETVCSGWKVIRLIDRISNMEGMGLFCVCEGVTNSDDIERLQEMGIQIWEVSNDGEYKFNGDVNILNEVTLDELQLIIRDRVKEFIKQYRNEQKNN